jgi:hypothetical protein
MDGQRHDNRTTMCLMQRQRTWEDNTVDERLSSFRCRLLLVFVTVPELQWEETARSRETTQESRLHRKVKTTADEVVMMLAMKSSSRRSCEINIDRDVKTISLSTTHRMTWRHLNKCTNIGICSGSKNRYRRARWIKEESSVIDATKAISFFGAFFQLAWFQLVFG